MKTRDRAYYRQRQKNRVFTELVQFFAGEAERRQITKKDLAEALAKDPAQITRWLSAPSNFELDTLSDILLALGAEMDHRIVRFSDRADANYAHPLVEASPKMTVEIWRPKLSVDSSPPGPTRALKVTTQGSSDLRIVPAIAVGER